MTTELIISTFLSNYEDNGELVEITQELIDVLEDVENLEVTSIPDNTIPEGAKGIPIGINTLLVKFLEVGGVGNLINAIGIWLNRDANRSIKLKLGDNSIELTGISKTEQQELIQWFKTQTGFSFTK